MIYPITFKANIQNTYNKKKDQNTMEGLKIKSLPKINPVKSGLHTTANWFGFGIILDRITGYFGKRMKTSPFITSIITNGIIAAGAGTYTYLKAKSNK